MDKKDLKRGRPALDPALILSELAKSSSNWRDIEVVAQVTSTNDIAIARLVASPNDAVFAITADEQLQGRGRLQREWSSPFGAGIALSIAIPTSLFSCPVSAIPLVVGVAVNTCLLRQNADAKLKWPNDLMVISSGGELKKVGGILVQRQNDHVVVGIGINTHLDLAELPTEFATSLAIEGIDISREILIAQILTEIEMTVQNATKNWHKKYVSMSCTLGNQVMATLMGGRTASGFASNVSKTGALILKMQLGAIEITAGDVVQIRPKGQ